jgi:hypothetical protein
VDAVYGGYLNGTDTAARIGIGIRMGMGMGMGIGRTGVGIGEVQKCRRYRSSAALCTVCTM